MRANRWNIYYSIRQLWLLAVIDSLYICSTPLLIVFAMQDKVLFFSASQAIVLDRNAHFEIRLGTNSVIIVTI